MEKISTLLHLNAFGILLLEAGYKLIVPEQPSTYFTFNKGNRFGYVQSDEYLNNTFTTVHRPCKRYGTGFRMQELDNKLKLYNATETLETFIPRIWANDPDIKEIKFYSSLEQYLADPLRGVKKVIEPIKENIEKFK
jgi:hypothetical protein